MPCHPLLCQEHTGALTLAFSLKTNRDEKHIILPNCLCAGAGILTGSLSRSPFPRMHTRLRTKVSPVTHIPWDTHVFCVWRAVQLCLGAKLFMSQLFTLNVASAALQCRQHNPADQDTSGAPLQHPKYIVVCNFSWTKHRKHFKDLLRPYLVSYHILHEQLEKFRRKTVSDWFVNHPKFKAIVISCIKMFCCSLRKNFSFLIGLVSYKNCQWG